MPPTRRTFPVLRARTLAALLLGGSVLGSCAPRPSVEGLFDVGGYRLFLSCQGAARGGPTVLLEHGIGEGASSESWVKVQPRVARFARVCRYDRADVGRSEASGQEGRTGRDLTRDLHTLLGRAGITGPYVLVGHSFGGYPARLYAAAYPRDVVGMVLVEAAHEDMITEIPLGHERLNLARIGEEVRRAGSLGPLPLVVVTRGRGRTPRWDAFQGRLVGLSTRGRQIVATRSDHEVPLRQPDVVVGAIRDVLGQAAHPGAS